MSVQSHNLELVFICRAGTQPSILMFWCNFTHSSILITKGNFLMKNRVEEAKTLPLVVTRSTIVYIFTHCYCGYSKRDIFNVETLLIITPVMLHCMELYFPICSHRNLYPIIYAFPFQKWWYVCNAETPYRAAEQIVTCSRFGSYCFILTLHIIGYTYCILHDT